ncbi:2-succinyl-6-hydroxy-2,4-cyclohexadiene-1-carboxy late synthase [Desulfotomaculum defluvii]
MFITIKDIKYNIQVKGKGKPIVCLHGFSENLSTWDFLELEGYQLILVDLIGHGESDKPHQSKCYRLRVILRHLNKLIYQLDIKKYSILGYSMGGRIALAYALVYPNEVEKLILESASYGECGLLNRLKRRKNDLKLAKGIREKGIEWFNEYWSNLSIFVSQKRLPKSVLNEISKRRLGNVAHALSNTLLCTGQGKFPCLKNKIVYLSKPILYISGQYDKKYQQIGNDFAKLGSNVKHVSIRGCGHNTHIEDPNTFKNVLSEFL